MTYTLRPAQELELTQIKDLIKLGRDQPNGSGLEAFHRGGQ